MLPSEDETSWTNEKGDHWVKRDWLNQPGHHSHGHIYSEVDVSETAWPIANLIIGDCARSVTLDFSFSNEEERLNAVRKLNLIKSHIEALETWLHHGND